MARKSKSKPTGPSEESKVPPILAINYEEPLFSVAAHPTRPIMISGLATGHLYCHSYDAEALENSLARKKEKYGKLIKDETSISKLAKVWWSEVDCKDSSDDVKMNWKTKRHKGSCRSVVFEVQENCVGEFLYSGGTDNVIKKASTETGKVVAKTDLSSNYENPKDAITTMAVSPSHPYLLAGTDDGHVYVYDNRQLLNDKVKFNLQNMHDDSVNQILPMNAVSPYHYLSLGSTTLTHFDIRKGILTQSDDQGDELLAMCYPTEYVNQGKNDTVLVSHGEGIVTLWRDSSNRLSDQILRIKVNKNASIDAIVPTMNAGNANFSDCVWCGDSEGLIHRVDYKKSKVVETRVHSAALGKLGGFDEVGGLDIDYDYRLISSGMEGLKVWSGAFELSDGSNELHCSEDEHWSDSDEDSTASDSEDESESDSINHAAFGSVDVTADQVKKRTKLQDNNDSSDDGVVKKQKTTVSSAQRDLEEKSANNAESSDAAKRREKNAKKKLSNNGIFKFDGI